jgi:hypothetical protein
VKIIGVNGIASTGEGTTDKALSELRYRGFETLDLNQPIRHTWSARYHAHEDAMDIVSVAEAGDVVVAHSYGCLKTALAARVVAFKAIFLFRPAMSRWHRFSGVSRETKIYCIYSPQDYTVLMGALLRFKHPFGLAGARGFKSPYVQNMRSHGSHSHDFKTPNLDYWMNFVRVEIE